MSRNYKFHNPEGLYFISFAVVGWLDVFTRNEYKDLFLESLEYCQKNKGLEIHAWCIMSNHVHLVFRSINNQKTRSLGYLKFSFVSDSADLQSVPTQYIDKIRR
jgi:REP element-mobilizing transposase RayT